MEHRTYNQCSDAMT